MILYFIVVSISQIVIVKAESTIYIRADGSVEETDKIQRNGSVYTFTDNICVGIQVYKSNIVVDGAWYTLRGDGEIHGPSDVVGMGIEIIGCRNVTVRNLNINLFTRGVRFTNSSDCIVQDNIIVDNSIGVEMGYADFAFSNNNTVSGNIIKENSVGIRLIHGSSNTISGNILNKNDEGISIWGTAENIIAWNNITHNNRGIYVEISGINIIHHNNFVDNTDDLWDYGFTPWPFQLPFSENIWDYHGKGNYWALYEGTDTNNDGVGDTPNVIYENNSDNFPLMQPVEVPIIIPEFPSWVILPLVLTIILFSLVIRKQLDKAKVS